MGRVRVIPTLLLNSAGGLVKTIRFGKRTYIGDPINAVRIYTEKRVDELILLDIDATREGRPPRFESVEEIAGEAFMPIGYGGGIRSVEDMAVLFRGGVEKVVLSSAAITDPGLVSAGAERFGSQSVVVCLDIRRTWYGGYVVTTESGRKVHRGSPEHWARRMKDAGAGEIIVNTIHRDGTYRGYDLDLLRRVSRAVDVPVVACGGAATPDDFSAAIESGCSAVAAGSMFVYAGSARGILITYPERPIYTP